MWKSIVVLLKVDEKGRRRKRDVLVSSVAPDFIYAQAFAVKFRLAASC